MAIAKALGLGGSFKLVTLAPKTVREMTQLPKETQKNGDKQTNQKRQINTHSTVCNSVTLGTGVGAQPHGNDVLPFHESINSLT